MDSSGAAWLESVRVRARGKINNIIRPERLTRLIDRFADEAGNEAVRPVLAQ